MKKVSKTLLMLGLAVCFCSFFACEKENNNDGERTEYDEQDDDWYKSASTNQEDIEGTYSYSVNQK